MKIPSLVSRLAADFERRNAAVAGVAAGSEDTIALPREEANG